MALQINCRQAILGLDIYPNTFHLHRRDPELSLDIEQPAVTVDIKQPEIQIELRRQFDELGYRLPVSMTRYYGQQGQQIVTKGIQRRVAEGNRLAQIHKPMSVAQMAADREQFPRKRRLTVEALPKTPPEIHFFLQPVKIDLAEGGVNGELHYGRVAVESQVGQVKAYFLQRPEVQIEYTGQAIDIAI